MGASSPLTMRPGPALLYCPGKGWAQLKLSMALLTSTWLQVAAQVTDICMTFGSMGYGHRYRPPTAVGTAMDINKDPYCSRDMTPDMVLSISMGPDSRGLSHHCHCISSSASLHSPQNHSVSLPLLSSHHIVAHGRGTCLPASEGSGQASATTHS